MFIRYFINRATGLPHIYDHGVSQAEVEQVLRDPDEDAPSRDGSRVAIGRTAGGRLLKVIYKFDPKRPYYFVITAYDVAGKPLTAYNRRERRRRS